MTPPHTNTPREVRRHWPALTGIALAFVVGIGVFLWWLFDEAATAPGAPEPTAPAVTEPLEPPLETVEPAITRPPLE